MARSLGQPGSLTHGLFDTELLCPDSPLSTLPALVVRQRAALSNPGLRPLASGTVSPQATATVSPCSACSVTGPRAAMGEGGGPDQPPHQAPR